MKKLNYPKETIYLKCKHPKKLISIGGYAVGRDSNGEMNETTNMIECYACGKLINKTRPILLGHDVDPKECDHMLVNKDNYSLENVDCFGSGFYHGSIDYYFCKICGMEISEKRPKVNNSRHDSETIKEDIIIRNKAREKYGENYKEICCL